MGNHLPGGRVRTTSTTTMATTVTPTTKKKDDKSNANRAMGAKSLKQILTTVTKSNRIGDNETRAREKAAKGDELGGEKKVVINRQQSQLQLNVAIDEAHCDSHLTDSQIQSDNAEISFSAEEDSFGRAIFRDRPRSDKNDRGRSNHNNNNNNMDKNVMQNNVAHQLPTLAPQSAEVTAPPPPVLPQVSVLLETQPKITATTEICTELPNGYSFAISEYVSVNRENENAAPAATAAEAPLNDSVANGADGAGAGANGGAEVEQSTITTSHTLKYLHKRRLDERGYRMTNRKLGEGGFGAVYKVYSKKVADSNGGAGPDGAPVGGGGGGGATGTALACKIMTLKRRVNPRNDPEPAADGGGRGGVGVRVKSRKERNSMFQAFSNEVFVMRSCRHPNIVAVRQFFIYTRGLSTDDVRMAHSYIVMEYATMGTLYGKLKKQSGPFREVIAQNYFAQICAALLHLHRRGIAHRDLKLGNILLTANNSSSSNNNNDHDNNDKNDNSNEMTERVLLTDFGLSRLVHSRKSGITRFAKPAGTLSYMSPELIACYVLYNSGQKSRIRPYDCFGADLWALGVSLFLMIGKSHPFDSPPAEKSERVAFARTMLEKQRDKRWQIAAPIRETITDDCVDLIARLMEPKHRRRFTIYQTIEHRWLASMSRRIVTTS